MKKFMLKDPSGDLLFIQTSNASPEQYNVLDHLGRKAGYVRLRNGELRCAYPDVGGEEIYTHNFDACLDAFESTIQRAQYLNEIVKAIHNKKRAIRAANKRKYARMTAC